MGQPRTHSKLQITDCAKVLKCALREITLQSEIFFADLDNLLVQCGRRPALRFLGCRQTTPQVQKLPFKPRPSSFRFPGQSGRKLAELLLSVTLRTSLRRVRCVENLPKAAVAFQFDRTSGLAQPRPCTASVTLARPGRSRRGDRNRRGRFVAAASRPSIARGGACGLALLSPPP